MHAYIHTNQPTNLPTYYLHIYYWEREIKYFQKGGTQEGGIIWKGGVNTIWELWI